jgi:hypothetical protein
MTAQPVTTNPGRTATQGTYKSNSQNGLGTILVDRAWYRSISYNAPYPIDVFLVLKLNILTTNMDIVGLGQAPSTDNFNSLTFNEYPNTTSYKWHNGSSASARTPNTVSTFAETSTTINNYLLMQWSIADTSYNIYRNGVMISGTASYTSWNKGTPGFQIGNRFYNDSINTSVVNINSNIGEIAAYGRILSNADRQKVEGYLAWKWGINSSLPVSHPYYSAAPTG